MFMGQQVVKMKTDYITDLEGRTAEGDSVLSVAQQALRNTLW